MQESLEIMKKSFSVCMVSFLGAFSLNIPRYFIDIHHHDQLGYFGIIATPVTLVVLLVTFILQPNIVRLSRYLGAKKYDDFNKEVFKMMCGTFGIGLGVLIAMYTVGAPLLSTVFGVDFSEYRNELVVITFGALASALVAIFTNMLIIMRKLTIQMYILLFMNVTVGIFSYFCIRNTVTFINSRIYIWIVNLRMIISIFVKIATSALARAPKVITTSSFLYSEKSTPNTVDSSGAPTVYIAIKTPSPIPNVPHIILNTSLLKSSYFFAPRYRESLTIFGWRMNVTNKTTKVTGVAIIPKYPS
jgi:O-antigen/teichoic acid export membrane protein